MSIFAEAMVPVFKREGRYDNDADDAGGETCWGVARNSNPDWPGWEVVDEAKLNNIPIESLDAKLQKLAGDLYEAKYWIPAGCDKIDDQRCAEYVFDVAVNHGVSVAVALWADHDKPLLPFGEIVMLRLILRRIIRYVKIVAKDPVKLKYFHGWIVRAMYPLS